MKTLVWIVIAFPMTMFAQETKVSKYLSLTGEWCNENLVLHANFGQSENLLHWTFNGQTLEETGTEINLTHYGPGTYTVTSSTLTGMSSDGLLAASTAITDTYEFELADGPTADFSYAPNYPIACIQFTNLTKSPSGDKASKEEYTYTWFFGDGTNAAAYDTLHAYMTEGIFQVTLTVTDSHGCSNTQTKEVPFFYPD